MPDLPNPEYQRMFQRVAAQGDAFAKPLLADDDDVGQWFYGFLAKADLSAEGGWDVFFELVNKQFLDNVLVGRTVQVRAPLPLMPALAYHLHGVAEADLLRALGIDKISELVEGSWYELQLFANGEVASGELYDPEPEAG